MIHRKAAHVPVTLTLSFALGGLFHRPRERGEGYVDAEYRARHRFDREWYLAKLGL
jgi:hypothetical protein